MSNTERVNLNINIQLQHLRSALKELNTIEAKMQNIQSGNVTASAQKRNNQFVEFKEYWQHSYKVQKAQEEAQKIQDAAKAKTIDTENKYLKGVAERVAYNKQYEVTRKANEEAFVKLQNDNAMEYRRQQMIRIDAERRAKIDMVKDVKKEALAEIAEEKLQWMNAVKQAFSLHIIQMYVQPFVRALNQLLRTTLTQFAEFDKYYADYLAKSMDFEKVVSRKEIFAGGVNQVYSIQNMADAMERFSASGIDLTQNQQALTDVLQLSVTAAITYDEAANSVIKTQEAFQLSINDSTMIVDALTNAANASTAELKDLTEWFGYASGMSHEAGINVQQLAAYLGILSSMGMKSAGTAFRQMLVQMTDENVRQKLQAAFGQEFNFLNMDETLLRMRAYVQASSNQAETIQKISSALGGKVNARESLTRLLTADEQTWNRIMSATERSGTAAELFDKMTDNAAGNLSKVKNNIAIILTQIGEAFSPILKVLVVVTGWIANFINAMPTFSKQLIGGLIILSGAFAAAIGLLVSLVGLFYMAFAANKMFEGGALKAEFSLRTLIQTMRELSVTLIQHATVTNTATQANYRFGASSQLLANATKNMKIGMISSLGAMVSYMGYQYAMEERSYALARALSLVSAAMTGAMLGTTIGGPIGAILGVTAGVGIGFAQQQGISRAQEESTLARRRASQYGKSDITTYQDTGAKNYFNIQQVTIPNVSNPEDLATGLYKESYL